jgi:hypothetical protein
VADGEQRRRARLEQHAQPARAGGMPEVELRARPAAVVGIPGAQPRVRPGAVMVGKALPELKAGDRRRPAQMQAGQWPERRASAARASEPGAVEPLPLQTARSQSDSVRESAPAAVGAAPAWPSSPREWVRPADVIP